MDNFLDFHLHNLIISVLGVYYDCHVMYYYSMRLL